MKNDLDLTTAADRFDIREGDVDTVVARARTRNRRRRVGLATVTTIAVVTGAVSFIGTRGDDGDRTNIAAGVTSGAVRGEDGLTWRRTDTPTALGASYDNGIAGDGPVYALSTGPGERRIENTRQKGFVWRSDDGIEWSSVSRLGSDLFLSDLAPAGERVYAVGTGPAQAARGSDLLAGWSDDGGKTWAKSPPLVAMDALAAKTTRISVTDTEVAANDKGTVVVAVLEARLDVPKLLPDGATAPHGWATTATGVDVLGPKREGVCPAGTTAEKGEPPSDKPGEVGPTYCSREDRGTVVSPQEARGVTASYTFEQLGVDGDLLRAVRSELLAFFAPPGSTDFERVELAPTPVWAPVLAVAGPNGFDVVATQRPGQVGAEPPSAVQLLHSDDGRTWSQARTQGGVAFATVAGTLGNAPAVLGGDKEGQPVLIRKGADGGWVTTPLADLIERPPGSVSYAGPAAIGPLGAAIAVTVMPEGRDGRMESQAPPSFRLLTSRDGVTWHDRPLEDLAGQRVSGVSLVHVTNTHVVVTAMGPRKEGENAETVPRITMVGTPG